MNESQIKSVSNYYKLLDIAAKHGIKKEVDIIIWDKSEANNKTLNDAMKSLNKFRKDLQKLDDLELWLSHEVENLNEADTRLQNRLEKEKEKENQKASIIKRIKTRSDGIVNKRLKENKQRRNRHLIGRMDELIRAKLTTRKSAEIVYKEEDEAGRSELTAERIRRIYFEANK